MTDSDNGIAIPCTINYKTGDKRRETRDEEKGVRAIQVIHDAIVMALLVLAMRRRRFDIRRDLTTALQAAINRTIAREMVSKHQVLLLGFDSYITLGYIRGTMLRKLAVTDSKSRCAVLLVSFILEYLVLKNQSACNALGTGDE